MPKSLSASRAGFLCPLLGISLPLCSIHMFWGDRGEAGLGPAAERPPPHTPHPTSHPRPGIAKATTCEGETATPRGVQSRLGSQDVLHRGGKV